MPNCRTCPHGPYSNESDICDHCQNDPDVGWGGFTDHRLGRHFYTEKERQSYAEAYAEAYDDITEDDI